MLMPCTRRAQEFLSRSLMISSSSVVAEPGQTPGGAGSTPRSRSVPADVVRRLAPEIRFHFGLSFRGAQRTSPEFIWSTATAPHSGARAEAARARAHSRPGGRASGTIRKVQRSELPSQRSRSRSAAALSPVEQRKLRSRRCVLLRIQPPLRGSSRRIELRRAGSTNIGAGQIVDAVDVLRIVGQPDGSLLHCIFIFADEEITEGQSSRAMLSRAHSESTLRRLGWPACSLF